MAETNVIRVRYWAAAKAAAGTDADDVPVNGSDDARRAARARSPRCTRTPAWPRCSTACSTLVGDQPVGTADPDAGGHRAGGSSVEFLPPFAGG